MNSTPEQLRFPSIPANSVRADFAGGSSSPDLGPVLLRGVDVQIGLTHGMAWQSHANILEANFCDNGDCQKNI